VDLIAGVRRFLSALTAFPRRRPVKKMKYVASCCVCSEKLRVDRQSSLGWRHRKLRPYDHEPRPLEREARPPKRAR
jgi:hypothetical protein